MNYEDNILSCLSENEIAGASISAFKDGSALIPLSFGKTRPNYSEKVDGNSMFELGSISKAVSAYLFLHFFDRNGLNLDSPISQYYPSSYSAWNVNPNDPGFRTVTARQILCHTSGFSNWNHWDPPVLRPFRFSPGDRFSYSGEGYMYLQKVFEYLSGTDLESYARRNMFDDLGLSNTSFVWSDDYKDKLVQGAGKRNSDVGKYWEVPSCTFSLYSNSSEFYSLLLALMADHTFSKTMQNMITPQIKLNQYCSWGLGVGIEHTSKGDYFWHWGDLGDYQCFFIASCNQQDGVVILTSGERGQRIFGFVCNNILGTNFRCSDYEFLSKL